MQLNYRDFLVELKVQLQKGVEADVMLKMGTVRKQNIGEQDCIMLVKRGESLSPNFYVQELFKKYQQGNSISNIVEEMIDNYEKHAADMQEALGNFRFI